MFETGRRCERMDDPGDYLFTSIEFATPERDDRRLGAVAHFEGRSFGEYLPPL